MNIIQLFADLTTDYLTTLYEKAARGEINFSDITSETENFTKNLGCILVENFLERLDGNIYAAAKITKKFVVKEKGVERKILSTFGEISFKRRYYRSKETGEYCYLLDKAVGIPAGDRMDANCKAELFNAVMDESYAKAVERVTGGAISKQAAKLAALEIGQIPEAAAPLPKTNPDAEEIYIEADEDHVSMQHEPRAAMYKLAYIYEDKMPVGKNRRELLAKRVFGGYDTPVKLWKQIAEYIGETYREDVKVTVIGDGANWIKAALQHIPNSSFALDPFHLSKYVKKICGGHTVGAFYALLRNNDKEGAAAYAAKCMAAEPWRKNAIEEGLRYVMNQWDGLQRSLNDENISSSTEAHVSHILSDRLSSRGMGWSRKGSLLIGSGRIYRENGGKVKAYALEKLSEEAQQNEANDLPESMKEEIENCIRSHKMTYKNDRVAVRMGHMPAAMFARYSFLCAIANGTE